MHSRDFFLRLHDAFWDPAMAARLARRPAFWGQLLGINLLACSVGFVLGGWLMLEDAPRRWDLPIAVLVRDFAAVYLVSFACATIGILSMARAMRAIWARASFPVNFLLAALYFVAVGIGGSAIAFGLFAVVGLIDPQQAARAWLTRGLESAIVASLALGLIAALIAVLRVEIDQATLALRVKERDEADARRLAAEAQLASLESRVQPHFLFNSLNSIASLARRNPQGAERMAVQLASLIRASLHDDPVALVPLGEELAVVRAYLDIERVRFGDRLRYRIDVPDALLAVAIPRLCLQTVVENSVKYAVNPRREGASIGIRGARTSGMLRLHVEDDGPGFASLTIPPGHGLALAQARLAMIFGERATLAVANRPGASVTIEVPDE